MPKENTKSVLMETKDETVDAPDYSKEERDKTVEFFMTLPISRVQVISSKLIAAVILNIILNLVTLAAIILSTVQYDKIDDYTKYLTLLMKSASAWLTDKD
jgi:ABC-type transport system involved in multi-copper enzyme maturation permease subunit